jgi:excisionase family DNA binding protein
MRLERDCTEVEPKRRSPREIPKPLSVGIDAACSLTGLGRTTVYQLISQGRLQSVTVGRRRLVLLNSIEELLRPRTSPDAALPGA